MSHYTADIGKAMAQPDRQPETPVKVLPDRPRIVRRMTPEERNKVVTVIKS